MEKSQWNNIAIILVVSMVVRIITYVSTMVVVASPWICLLDPDKFDNIIRFGYAGAPLYSCRELPLLSLVLSPFYYAGIPIHALQLWSTNLGASLGICAFYCVLEKKQVKNPLPIALILTAQPYYPMIASPGDPIYVAFFLFWVAYYFFQDKKYKITLPLLVLLSMSHVIGVLMGTLMLLNILRKKKEYLVFLACPLTLLAIFTYFYVVRGDFFLYVHAQQAYLFGSELSETFAFLGGLPSFADLNMNLLIVLAFLVGAPVVAWVLRQEDYIWPFIGVTILSLNLVGGMYARYLIPFVGLYIWLAVRLLRKFAPWNDKYFKILIPILIVLGVFLAARAQINLTLAQWTAWGQQTDPSIVPY